MEVIVINTDGKGTGRKVNLNDAIFGIEPNDHAIYLDVKQHLANKRQGTHKSKERAEIARSTKKAFRQKGTGGARRGSYKSPLVRGGGRVFGPKPRDYSFKLNKKLKNLARLSALSYKAKEQNITVLENFNIAAPKTKDFIAILKNLKLENEKVLLVIGKNDRNIVLSSRNIERKKVVTASDINTYDILNAGKLVLTEDSISAIESALNNK
jgi:large subunit ribosomal protein L4